MAAHLRFEERSEQKHQRPQHVHVPIHLNADGVVVDQLGAGVVTGPVGATGLVELYL
jgi:hypothetical protein